MTNVAGTPAEERFLGQIGVASNDVNANTAGILRQIDVAFSNATLPRGDCCNRLTWNSSMKLPDAVPQQPHREGFFGKIDVELAPATLPSWNLKTA